MGLLRKQNTRTPASVSNDYADEFIQAKADRDSFKVSTIVSIGAVGVAVLCLVLFFMSDLPSKIVSAKTSPPIQTVSTADTSDDSSADVPDVNYNAGDSYVMATLPGLIENIDQDELLNQIEAMDAAEYDAFVASLAKLLQSDDPESVLREMDPDVRIYFGGNAADGAEDENTSDSATSENAGAVVDAYDVAESLFGDAIDGSKRLKLIEELNAVDYKYYVAEKGDTLISLSETFDIGLGQLVEFNGIHDADELPAGMIIILPSETTVPDDEKVVEK